jgi:hypothetical protein
LKPPGMGARQQRPVDAGPPEPQWPSTLMALSVLILIVVFWTIGQRTLITFTELFRWLALFAFAGNFLPRRWVEKRFEMARLEWFWFNLLAVGPLLLTCCLILNFLVHGPEQKILVNARRGFDLHEYWRINDAFPPHLPWPADFGADPARDHEVLSTAGAGELVFGIARGSFGYQVITSQKEVKELKVTN